MERKKRNKLTRICSVVWKLCLFFLNLYLVWFECNSDRFFVFTNSNGLQFEQCYSKRIELSSNLQQLYATIRSQNTIVYNLLKILFDLYE